MYITSQCKYRNHIIKKSFTEADYFFSTYMSANGKNIRQITNAIMKKMKSKEINEIW